MSNFRYVIRISMMYLLVAFSTNIIPTIAFAESEAMHESWKFNKNLQGKTKKNPSEGFKDSTDVSGLACATESGFPRICIIVDDETQGAQIVVLNDGSLIAGQFIRLITDTFDEKKGDGLQPVELDAEGVAFADGTFYVIGSHGWPRLKNKDKEQLDPAVLESLIQARAKAARHLFAITFDLNKVDLGTGMLKGDYDVKNSVELTSILKAEPLLKDAFDSPLDQYGVTIEGIAARDGELFIGLRSPVAGCRDAIVIEVPIATLFGGVAGSHKPHRLELGQDAERKPRGIRDLCTVGKGFLVIAGPILDPEPKEKPIAREDYAIFGWDGTSKPVELTQLGGFPAGTKPEGCWPLAESQKETELLIVFDGPQNGVPKDGVSQTVVVPK